MSDFFLHSVEPGPVVKLTLQPSEVTKTELLLTTSIQYQPDM